MNEMLAYSIHLGNDKNKTKKAKEIAKEHLKNDKIIDEYTIGHHKK